MVMKILLNKETMKYFLGILLILLGIKIITVQKFYGRGGFFDFTNPYIHWPFGIFLILYGLYIIYYVYKSKK